MSSKVKGKLKDNIIFFLSVVPLLNCIPFFYMNNRVKKKKWMIMGIVVLLIYSALFTSAFIIITMSNPYDTYEYKQAMLEEPESDDFITDEEFKEKYGEGDKAIYGWINDTPEYKEYQQEHLNWEKKHQAVLEPYENFNSFTYSYPEYMFLMFMPLITVMILVLTMVERGAFLKLINQQSNKADIRQRLSGNYNQQNVTPAQRTQYMNSEQNFVAPQMPNPAPPVEQPMQAVPSPQAPVQQAYAPAPTGININTATEDELADLPGLTIIDAKKAISVRDKNGGFRNVDEFYSAINARPHIIAGIMDKIYVGEVEAKPVSENAPKRRIEF